MLGGSGFTPDRTSDQPHVMLGGSGFTPDRTRYPRHTESAPAVPRTPLHCAVGRKARPTSDQPHVMLGGSGFTPDRTRYPRHTAPSPPRNDRTSTGSASSKNECRRSRNSFFPTRPLRPAPNHQTLTLLLNRSSHPRPPNPSDRSRARFLGGSVADRRNLPSLPLAAASASDLPPLRYIAAT